MSVDAFFEEAETMHKLQHPKLVQLMGVCTKDPDKLLIVTELMCNSSLKDYLQKHSKKREDLPLRSLVDIIVQVRGLFPVCLFL